jgi:cytochrome c
MPFRGGYISLRPTQPSSQQRNTAPIVKINEPGHQGVYSANTLVSYSVSVSDKEDGDSRYDEIPSNSIFLELSFHQNSLNSNEGAKHKAIDRHGLTLMMRSDCFNCHQFKSRNIGPAFSQIAMKYESQRDAHALAARIMNGSTGLWGEEIMPAHPDLSEEQTLSVVQWILKYGGTETLDYVRGKSGTFPTTLPRGKSTGYFIVRAMYTDNGTDGNNVLTGYDSVIVHCR